MVAAELIKPRWTQTNYFPALIRLWVRRLWIRKEIMRRREWWQETGHRRNELNHSFAPCWGPCVWSFCRVLLCRRLLNRYSTQPLGFVISAWTKWCHPEDGGVRNTLSVLLVRAFRRFEHWLWVSTGEQRSFMFNRWQAVIRRVDWIHSQRPCLCLCVCWWGGTLFACLVVLSLTSLE